MGEAWSKIKVLLKRLGHCGRSRRRDARFLGSRPIVSYCPPDIFRKENARKKNVYRTFDCVCSDRYASCRYRVALP
jgi:hypothetical protein